MKLNITNSAVPKLLKSLCSGQEYNGTRCQIDLFSLRPRPVAVVSPAQIQLQLGDRASLAAKLM